MESEEGMLLDIPDFPNFRIKDTIAGVCADTNKGAHEIGFLGPSATKFCRLCLISRDEIKQKSCFDQLEMRNRYNYDDAVKYSAANPEKASETGIRSCCVLNRSKYFHFGENDFRCYARFFRRCSPVYDQTSFMRALFLPHNKDFCSRN